MVPVIASGGTSFKGAFLYYSHDKGAQTSARVAWTETVNMMTDCAKKAWKVMAYTAKSAVRLKEAAGEKLTGRKLEKPVFAYSLSWHPEQKPDKETMLEAAKLSLEKLGLSAHEAMIVAHQDEPQPHLHCIVNRCHPLTGKAAKMNHSKRKLSDFAREWEHMEGKVYCMKREENYQKRQKGKPTRYAYPIITQAWEKSDTAQGFKNFLETKGYNLAQGRKRLVVVDAYGKTVNPLRHLEGVRAKEFNERMATLDTKKLPTPEAILETRKSKEAREDKNDSEQENGIDKQETHNQTADHEPENAVKPKEAVSDEILDEPNKSAKLKAYEDRVIAAMDELAGQHFNEWKRTSERHSQIIETKRAELTKGLKLEKRQVAIDTIQAKLDAPRFLPKFARNIFGTDRKLKNKIEALQEQQKEAKERFDEGMKKLAKDRDKDLQNLDAAHAKRKRELSEQLEKWRPSSLSKEFDRSRNDHTLIQDNERSNDGPSLNF